MLRLMFLFWQKDAKRDAWSHSGQHHFILGPTKNHWINWMCYVLGNHHHAIRFRHPQLPWQPVEFRRAEERGSEKKICWKFQFLGNIVRKYVNQKLNWIRFHIFFLLFVAHSWNSFFNYEHNLPHQANENGFLLVDNVNWANAAPLCGMNAFFPSLSLSIALAAVENHFGSSSRREKKSSLLDLASSHPLINTRQKKLLPKIHINTYLYIFVIEISHSKQSQAPTSESQMLFSSKRKWKSFDWTIWTRNDVRSATWFVCIVSRVLFYPLQCQRRKRIRFSCADAENWVDILVPRYNFKYEIAISQRVHCAFGIRVEPKWCCMWLIWPRLHSIFNCKYLVWISRSPHKPTTDYVKCMINASGSYHKYQFWNVFSRKWHN